MHAAHMRTGHAPPGTALPDGMTMARCRKNGFPPSLRAGRRRRATSPQGAWRSGRGLWSCHVGRVTGKSRSWDVLFL